MSDKEFKPIALFHGEADKVSPLARYGEARMVRAMADRVQITSKSKHGLTENEALLVAQAAIATGLNPFEPQPELWHWVAVRGDQRYLTIMRGRDGTIRLSEEAAKRAGTRLEPPRFREIQDKRERQRIAIPEGALASEATVEDYKTTAEYYKRRNQLKDEGLSSEEIDERVGKFPPSIKGVGILTQKEMKAFEQSGNKMPHINRVRKRAYTEALKQKWAPQIDTTALSEGHSPELDEYIVEGEWMDVEVIDEPSPKRAKKASESLYGVECPACGGMIEDPIPDDCPHCNAKDIKFALKKRDSVEGKFVEPEENQESNSTKSEKSQTRETGVWEDNILEKIKDLGLVQAKPHAVHILNKSLFVKVPPGKLEMIEVVAYFCAWESLKQELPTMKTDERASALNLAFEEGNNDAAIEKAIELLGG